MNKELIQKFLNNACWDEQAQYELEDWINVEKFAELIVRECISALDKEVYIATREDGEQACHEVILLEHFGVEA